MLVECALYRREEVVVAKLVDWETLAAEIELFARCGEGLGGGKKHQWNKRGSKYSHLGD